MEWVRVRIYPNEVLFLCYFQDLHSRAPKISSLKYDAIKFSDILMSQMLSVAKYNVVLVKRTFLLHLHLWKINL